ncbi:unnamed protein product [Schistosoma turkestanicum]|nr:unnamed protein product [Schistosoma turkestanicum]
MSSWLSDLANKAENFLNTLDNSAAEVFKPNEQQQHEYPYKSFLRNDDADAVAAATIHDDLNKTSRYYALDEAPLSIRTLTDANHHHQPNSLFTNTRYDMPVTVKSLEMLTDINTTNTTTIGSSSSTLVDSINNNTLSTSSPLSLSSVQNKISRNKELKSTTKLNTFKQKSTDLDLLEFLNDNNNNDHTQTKIQNTDHLVNSFEQKSILSINSNNLDAESNSGYMTTSLSSKHSGLSNKSSKNEESSTGITVHHEHEQLTTTSTATTTGPREDSSKQLRPPKSTLIGDLQLENKLLRSEVSSLSQEVSELLRRNHKASEEIKQLNGQIDHLNSELKESDQRIHELSNISTNQKSVELLESTKLKQTEIELSIVQNNLNYVTSQLETNKLTINNLEASLHESRQQNSIAEKRIELIQKDNQRLARELIEYEEKANHILAMKEQVISSLRNQNVTTEQLQTTLDNNDYNSDNELLNSIRAECDLLREESMRRRQEVEQKELELQESLLQWQAEKDSLRRRIELCEEQAEREKQLRKEADLELVHSRQSIQELEETFHAQQLDLQNKLKSTETELVKLKQLLLSESNEKLSIQNNTMRSPSASCCDNNSNTVLLESRIRQLTDNLLSKQDALDSVLAQNHALKIRLDRVLTDNESLISALPNYDQQSMLENGRSYQFSMNSYGCHRLNLHATPIPKQFKPFAYYIDNYTIRLANTLRRFPLIRLVVMLYFLMVHLSLISVFLLPMNNNDKFHRDSSSMTIVDASSKRDSVGSGSGSGRMAIDNPLGLNKI